MDGLEWKTLWKWMIWGCFPIFGNTQVFLMGPLRIVKQNALGATSSLDSRLNALSLQQVWSPGVFFEGGRWVNFPYIWWFQIFFDVQGGPKNQL